MSEVIAHAVTGLSNSHYSFPPSPRNSSAPDLGYFTPHMNLWLVTQPSRLSTITEKCYPCPTLLLNCVSILGSWSHLAWKEFSDVWSPSKPVWSYPSLLPVPSPSCLAYAIITAPYFDSTFNNCSELLYSCYSPYEIRYHRSHHNNLPYFCQQCMRICTGHPSELSNFKFMTSTNPTPTAASL